MERFARRTAVTAAVALIAFSTLAGVGRALAATAAADPVRGFYDTLLNTMRQRQKLEVGGEKPYGAAILVDTRIVKSDGEPVSINYLMRRDGDAWRIADVYLTGTISELATRRAEFAAVLRRDGVDALIATLNSKSGDKTVAARS